jgi:hypothetical protein
MIAEIRKHLDKTPFQPFSIRIADGHKYPVPTLDHVYLPPGGAWVVVSDDEGVVAVLPAPLISGLVHKPQQATPE